MQRTMWCMGMLRSLFLFGIVGLGEAAELVSPPEGAVYEAGQSYLVRVEPGDGEKLISMLVGFNEVKPDSRGILEYTINLPVDVKLGSRKRSVSVNLYDRNGQQQEIDLSRNITVILPPTTTVTGIGVDFTGQKRTSAQIGRKPNGELVRLRGFSEKKLSVGADYSDGVARDMAGNPDVTYKSLNEKVAIVFPPGQFRKADGNVRTGYATVQATGPGETDIIVQYGEFTDRVTVHVRECPYIEGKTDEDGCPRR